MTLENAIETLNQLVGRTVLVTGASQGQGLCRIEEIDFRCSAGCRVVCVPLSDPGVSVWRSVGEVAAAKKFAAAEAVVSAAAETELEAALA